MGHVPRGTYIDNRITLHETSQAHIVVDVLHTCSQISNQREFDATKLYGSYMVTIFDEPTSLRI